MEQPLFDRYFEYSRDTEPHPLLHRWSLVPSVGAWLGRQFYFPFGDFRVFPNLFVMIVGDPGSRKSTAIKQAKRLMGAAGYQKFAADKTTKEKFLLDLEGVVSDGINEAQAAAKITMDDILTGHEDHTPKEVFVVADEFNEFMGTGNIEFLSLLGNFWDYDDDSTPYTYRLKNSRSVSIWNPTVSLLGGNTPESFAACFPPQANGQGFLSRLILIHGELPKRKITFPKKPPDGLRQEIVAHLVKMKEVCHGEADVSRRAGDMLHVIYNSHPGVSDVRFKNYNNRRFTHLLKLCLVCTAERLSTRIEERDVLLANTILSYAEHLMPQAMGEYGKSRDMDVRNKIMAVLTDAKAPVTLPELWTQVQSDLDRYDELIKLLVGLQNGGKIQSTTNQKGVQGFLPIKARLNDSQPYVDYSLLTEAKK